MAYKCRICNANNVDHPGDICDLCAIGQDPYAAGMGGQQGGNNYNSQGININSGSAYGQNRGRSKKVLINRNISVNNTSTDSYGNYSVPSVEPDNSVKVYRAGTVPAQKISTTVGNTGSTSSGNSQQAQRKSSSDNTPITYGVTKNISVDTQKRSFLQKWFRSLFSGIPFTIDDEITMFQVFPDFSGTSLNAQGNACDQVIVYGKVAAGAIAENNDIEVYGRRDSNNNVIAKKIKNKASGTTVTPDRIIGVSVIWFITLLIFAAIFFAANGLGIQGIVWIAILVICVMNIPFILKIVGVLFGVLFSMFKRK